MNRQHCKPELLVGGPEPSGSPSAQSDLLTCKSELRNLDAEDRGDHSKGSRNRRMGPLTPLEHTQLSKYQKIMLPKSLDVDSARRAIELPCVCHSRQKPFLLESFQKHRGIVGSPIFG